RVRYNDDGQRWTSWNTMLTSKNLSDAVTNPARDIPASVGGVKIAYDHGTTALNAANAAKKAADNANHELNNTYRKNRFKDRRCPSHYNGAQVFDISTQDDGGIRIIIMSALWGGGETVLNLPEAFSGFAIPTAVDLGGGRKKLGIAMEGNNKIRVFAPSGIIGIHVHVIGFTHF
ncbi:MAG: hypothetical protein SOX56_00825, partial [[Pasteurella] mairii]|nr:hypothetical protein [[Pasteurella] mairii]